MFKRKLKSCSCRDSRFGNGRFAKNYEGWQRAIDEILSLKPKEIEKVDNGLPKPESMYSKIFYSIKQ